MLRISLCTLLIGVTLINGQQKPCCFPDQWEGKAISGSKNSRFGSFGIFTPKIAVDFTNRQFAVHEYVVPSRRHHRDEDFMDSEDLMNQVEDDRRPRVYNITTIGKFSNKNSKMYIILWKYKKCFTKNYPGKPAAKKHCIPSKAKFGGSATIGGDSGVTVDRWLVSSRQQNETLPDYDVSDYIDDMMETNSMAKPKPRPRGYAAAAIVVARKSCIPVSEHVFVATRRSRSAVGTMFFDITGGIKDKAVFNPPSFCKKDDDDNEDDISDMEISPLVNYFVDKFN